MKSSASSGRQGIALVLVLAFLALITVFVVGFFSSATGELRSSSSYAASATTRQLADSATNLVMGQIRAGTTRHADGTSPDKPEYKITYDSWASQPGMIRTYAGGATASANSGPSALFKLYSSDQMILESGSTVAGYRGQNDINPKNAPGWQTQPALFTDLNEPVYTVASPEETGANAGPAAAATATVPRYPIFDPAAFAKYNSEDAANAAKFVPSLTEALPVEGAKVVGDQSLSSSSPDQQYSRMPVRWLYSLKDGSLVAPAAGPDGKTAKFTNPGIQPTADNPIVGRIAFWTDDDSCKVNVNTAGGYTMIDVPGKNTANYAGSFWDTPRLGTLFDIGSVDKFAPDRITNGLSASQPAAGEFQRYPGHPATTSLGLVFNMLSSEQIYNLAPRLMRGGSLGGTVQTKSEIDTALNTTDKQKYDRLYSSVDELLYVFDAGNLGTVTATQRARAPQAAPTKYKNLLPASLDQYRFFLTAHSRAPELNLYGRPRVTLWPVWPIFGNKTGVSFPHTEYNPTSNQNLAKTYGRDDFRGLCNTQDKLIAFCSLVGTSFDDPDARPYIFQRYDPYSSTNDAGIQRNRDLLDYLAKLTNTPVPGFGGTFNNRGADFDRNQVLAEIFDYIRCVNLQDSTHDPVPTFAPGGPSFPTPARTFKYAPHGVVVPSVLKDYGNSPGFGRYPTISEISLDFYHAGYWVYEAHPIDAKTKSDKDPKTGKPLTPLSHWVFDRKLAHDYITAKKNGGATYTGPEVKGKMIAAFLMLETFNPMQGFSTLSDFDPAQEVNPKRMYMMHRVRGMDKFKIKTAGLGTYQSLQMPADATNAYFTMSGKTWGGRNSGGSEGFVHPFYYNTAATAAADPVTALNHATGNPSTYTTWYPFQSTPTANGFPPSGSVMEGLPLPGNNVIDPITHKPKPGNPRNGVLVRQDDTSFNFQGGELQIELKWGQQPDKVLYSYIAKFPDSQSPWPIPTDNIWYGGDSGGGDTYDSGGFYQGTMPLWKDDPRGTQYGWRKAADASQDSIFIHGKVELFADYQFYFYKRLNWSNHAAAGSVSYWDPKAGGDGFIYSRRWRQMLQPGDTIRSLLPQDPTSKGTSTGDGDTRIMALVGPPDATTTGSKDKYFGPHPYYFQQVRHAETLRCADGTPYIYRDDPAGGQTSRAIEDDSLQNPFAKPGALYFPLKDYPKFGAMVAMNNKNAYTQKTAATLPPGVNGVHLSDGTPGDFDCGTGTLPDGAYAGKVDEGAYAWKFWDSINHIYYYGSPYYPPSAQSQASFSAHFSPNRQISSAISFGSLLTSRTKHWQTLAFSPNTASRLHPGNVQTPKDHLLLDLFTMPVVEPYAISEPFSTAGKVNLNYPIEPFGYIKRTTALRAAMQPLRITALPADTVGLYKGATPVNYRYPVDRDMTIGVMDKFFFGTAAGSGGGLGQLENIYRSASQVCEIFLVPQSPATQIPVKDPLRINPTIMRDWWKLNPLTADNMREKPYADLYPRITTKSNTFTVYMRVQVLRKVPVVGSPADVAKANLQWTEGKDQVLSEYRGSSTIERYLDPADPRINGRNPERNADGMNPDTQSLEPAYKFRVIESKRFRP